MPQGTLQSPQVPDKISASMKPFASRWLRQAEADLKAARDSLQDSNYEWSCFQSQQAAEKALKAYLYEKGYTSIMTHLLKELVFECEKHDRVFSTVMSDAKHLDMHYISTRYPNGLGGNLTPSEFYEEEDAQRCVSCAESILKIVKQLLSE
ncbi:MAG: HEPN domain-containing protein [Candidatus Bathyarchaeia archaeon]